MGGGKRNEGKWEWKSRERKKGRQIGRTENEEPNKIGLESKGRKEVYEIRGEEERKPVSRDLGEKDGKEKIRRRKLVKEDARMMK